MLIQYVRPLSAFHHTRMSTTFSNIVRHGAPRAAPARTFKDRSDAGRRLAQKLWRFKGAKDTVLFALPRGGVVVAHAIAEALDLPIDLVITRKIGHPVLPEYAIAAVSEDGALVVNERERELVSPTWFAYEIENATREAQRRRTVYMKRRPHADRTKMTAIIVDDGIATGLTLEAAIASIKKHDPERVIVAVPVMPAELMPKIKKGVDELVVLIEDRAFRGAVGAYYDSFEQLSDKDVCDLLALHHFYDDVQPLPVLTPPS
jgi:predicted phosphoribosyltransferase